MIYWVNDRGEVLIQSDLTLAQLAKFTVRGAPMTESEQTSQLQQQTAR